MVEFSETQTNQKEITRAKINLDSALNLLAPELLEMGVYKVTGKVVALAKEPLAPSEELIIDLGDDIDSIALIELNFYFRDGNSKNITINGWQDEGTQHLSGPASVDTFVQRIRKGLEMEKTTADLNDRLEELRTWLSESGLDKDKISEDDVDEARTIFGRAAEILQDHKLSNDQIKQVIRILTKDSRFDGIEISLPGGAPSSNIEYFVGILVGNNINLYLTKDKGLWHILCKEAEKT